jgi:hypothetical protein
MSKRVLLIVIVLSCTYINSVKAASFLDEINEIANQFLNQEVQMVKDGVMLDYPTTTIGRAFEAGFDEPSWQLLETEKGERIVQFDGRISESLHRSFADNLESQLERL